MPQMSPLLWLNLYFTFTVTLIIFVSLFFFTKSPQSPPHLNNSPKQHKLNWKW